MIAGLIGAGIGIVIAVLGFVFGFFCGTVYESHNPDKRYKPKTQEGNTTPMMPVMKDDNRARVLRNSKK